MDIKNNILETIGNTPLIRLNKITRDFPCTVLAKVDYFNPGNSVKDRMALKMVEVAEKEGKLKPGGNDHRRYQWQYRDGARTGSGGERI